jgi:hypothetical protein
MCARRAHPAKAPEGFLRRRRFQLLHILDIRAYFLLLRLGESISHDHSSEDPQILFILLGAGQNPSRETLSKEKEKKSPPCRKHCDHDELNKRDDCCDLEHILCGEKTEGIPGHQRT